MKRPAYRPQRYYRRKPTIRGQIRRAERKLGKVLLGIAMGAALIGSIAGTGNISAGSSGSHTSPAGQAHLIDRVTRVRDGDTIVVGLIPIRVANLDCAEKGTAYGDRATRRVKQLVSGQTLTCTLEGRRSYDREVGVCSLPDGRDLGEVMIAEGVCGRWR